MKGMVLYMKDMFYERLILLAAAQEKLNSVTDTLEQWDNSLHSMEKYAFEAINTADKVLNISGEGERLVRLLQECFLGHSDKVSSDVKQREAALLDSINRLFHEITEISAANIELSHKLETVAVGQKELKDEVTGSLSEIGERLNCAIACAELVVAEKN